MQKRLITIDGPSGAGKSTVSRELARRLEYTYVDTGALYRGVAVFADARGCRPDDDSGLAELCEHLVLQFVKGPRGVRLHGNGRDITDRIRTPEMTMLASAVSARPVVRTYLLDVQRNMAEEGGVIFEGRDMGTVVFPGADIKFFLDADGESRARRRHRELLESDSAVTLDEVREAMKKRDEADSSRQVAPLKPAPDAVRIDSTALTVEQVVGTMLDHITKLEK